MPYLCTAGHLTIGVGHKLLPHEIEAAKDGWSDEQVQKTLLQDIHIAMRGVEMIFGRSKFLTFSEARQRALVSMCFQLGANGLAGFKRMIAAIRRGDWEQAYIEALDSKWAKKDTPARAHRVAKIILEG